MKVDGIAQVIQVAVDYRVTEEGVPAAYLFLQLHTREGTGLDRALLYFSQRDKPQVTYTAEKRSLNALLPIGDFDNLYQLIRAEKELYLEWTFGTDGKFVEFAFRTYPKYFEAFPTDEMP